LLVAPRDAYDIARMESAAVTGDAQQERVKTLRLLFEMFEGNDAAAEVRRLKAEDQGF